MVYNPSRSGELATLDELREYIRDELDKISKEFNETTALDLRTVFREPTNPREGMIVSADGTSWDPGSGAGAYEYVNGVWRRLYNQIKGILGGNGGTGSIAAGQTRFVGFSGLTTVTETEVYFPVPFACTFTNLNVVSGGAPGGSETLIWTLRKTLADTALVATITGGTNVASGSGSVAFAAGDRVAIEIVSSGGAPTLGGLTFGLGYTVP